MRVLCWDLDNTLGYFPTIGVKHELVNPSIVKGSPEGIRQGIVKLLSDLELKEYKQVVTTSSPQGYSRDAVEAAKLAKYIEGLFTEVYESQLHGKRYNGVVTSLGLAQDTAGQNMLAIGDGQGDISCDVADMTFIQIPGAAYSADILRPVLAALGNEATFFEGFNKLYSRSQPEGGAGSGAKRMRYVFAPGIEATLTRELQDTYEGNMTIPKIRVHGSDKFLRGFVPFNQV